MGGEPQQPEGEPSVPVPVVSAAKAAEGRAKPRKGLLWAIVVGAVATLAVVAAVGVLVIGGLEPEGPEDTPAAASAGETASAAPGDTPGGQGSEDAGSATADVGSPPAAADTAAAPEGDPRDCPDRTGTWAGTWAASLSRGQWTADFRQEEAEDGSILLHGDIQVTGTACGTGGHIVGRIRGDCGVEFDPYDSGMCRVRYTATFEGDDTLSGTVAASGFGMADSGRWRGTRRSSGAEGEGEGEPDLEPDPEPEPN